MRSVSRLAFCLLLTSVLPMVGCAKPSAADSPAATSTNAQGCVRKRHLGPQDPFQTPPPLMEACLGPYKLRIPANYFGDQMGPNFDDSFGLYLEHPTLQPFAPGERTHLRLDVSTRTVYIAYHYLDRVDVHEALRRRYTGYSADKDNPAEHLESRLRQSAVYGLTPYYADLPKVFSYYKAKGYRSSAPVFKADEHDDWYVERDANGEIRTFIKCTSHVVAETGVEYRDGKLVRSQDAELPECHHLFALPEISTLVEVRYVRAALPDWKRIEDAARSYIEKFMVKGNRVQNR
ncbi:hypothetical protein [Xanthomonas translucens]|uniref:Lipoprotein n=3 Tax=Xanthomonas campestris pv. translucens TaxID=343 RepID=A0A120EYH5_XANCT|nr:hypothetical protein [Xanthomonas translucens]KWV16057.1 hypothetical protein ATB53_10495 [Xanthomonas translucens]MCC8448420.1 hypothetical protein [Xanthomonas translucens pv. translucens]MCT8287027.1 hypothetical protein [Xanthomonas translucens pv. translucens]MCT8304685.1 hypothetical protein [Xanthomonas translucens pv. translucens]QSQ30756.1 hypothetical protein ISN30_02360 [Xanthomonas translucens pv. translucens]